MVGKGTSSMDAKGRVLIPGSLRDLAGLKEGERLLLEYDEGRKAVLIEPAHERRLLCLRIELGDSPGSLAAAASALAKIGVDLVSTQSHSSRRGEAAVWEVKCNPNGKGVGAIKAALSKVKAGLAVAKWE